MEIRQLRYFVTLAEELHFGRAAERLHIVQSAVSQQLRRLERELGTALFDRTPRTVRLTQAGRVFLPEARAVLAAESRARARIAELADRPRVLRLGTSNGLGEHLDRVLSALPGVTVELVAASTRSRLDDVRAGRLDATFVRGLSGSPELRLIPLWQDRIVVALPINHPLVDAPSVDLADLAAMPLRLPDRDRNAPLYDLLVTTCRAVGFDPLLGPASTTLQDTLATVGSSPDTWTVVYESHANQLIAPRVAFRRTTTPLTMPTQLAVSATHPPRDLDALLKACG